MGPRVTHAIIKMFAPKKIRLLKFENPRIFFFFFTMHTKITCLQLK